jgi:hypothetical protein
VASEDHGLGQCDTSNLNFGPEDNPSSICSSPPPKPNKVHKARYVYLL